MLIVKMFTNTRTLKILAILFYVFVLSATIVAVPLDEDYVMVPLADTVAVRQNRIDFRDLGYAPHHIIPPGQSAITALLKAENGRIYGGTSGKAAHLFVYCPQSNKVRPLGQMKGQNGIYHSLVQAGDGKIYIGTLRSRQGDGIAFEWQKSESAFEGYEGGHLFLYDPNGEDERKVAIADECKLTDLGIPVKGDGIYTLTYGERNNEIYGMTFPNGHFFVYHLDTGLFSDKGRVFEQPKIGARQYFKSITRALICDKAGNVYGSWDKGRIFKYDPIKQQIVKLELQLPSLKGREFSNVVDCFVKDSNGIIYGGTSDGYLFRFEPENMKIINLGKPIGQGRIRGLTFGKDNKLYGIGGEEDGICSLFSYNPANGEYNNLGLIESYRKPYYSWLGYQFDAMVAGDDGTIYIGESDRKSHLFMFYPW